MADAGRLLQSIIYDTLSNGLSVSVYDRATNAPFPYVTVGDDVAVDSSSKVDSSQEFVVTIHVWSRQRGRWEAKQIISDIDDLLHNQSLTIPGVGSPLSYPFVISSIHRDSSQTFLDPDGLTTHGVTTFRVRVNHEV